MSSEALLLVLVAGYVGIIVLWHLTVSDSLYSLAVLRARLRHRWPQWRDRLALVFDRSRAAAVLVARAQLRRRRYLTGALAGAAIVGLAAVAVGTQAFGSKGKVGPTAALGPHSANPAPLHPSRPLAQPVDVADAHTRRSPRVTGQASHPRVQRAHEQPTKVVSLVRVSARVSPASATVSRQVTPSSNNPAPLPAPAPSSGPSPLAAP
jgi:hypothetical protein